MHNERNPLDKELLGLISFTQISFMKEQSAWTFKSARAKSLLFNHFHQYHDSAIQFTGTLYNSHILKNKLSLNETLSDAQLLLIAYEKWGTSLLKELEGIFSFALFDKQKNIVILAKDRISIKPLYYYHDSDSFLFGSSLKTLSNLDLFSKNINISALSNYFTYGYIMQPNTIYKNCFKIKSGHFLTFDILHKTFKEEKYWDLGSSYETPKLNISEREFKEEAKNLLKQSIEKRLPDEGEYAASLSGGYDSSTVAALLQEKSAKKIKTFTMGFEDESINEAPEAKKIANHLGTEHIEHYFSASDALKIVPMLSEVYDEPFYDNGSIPTTLLASIAKEHGISTIFAGDGGDEVFATADDIERFDRILSFPQYFRNGIYSILNSFNPSMMPYLKENKNIPTKYFKFINIIKAKNIPEMVKVKMTLFHPSEISTLIQSNDIHYASVFDDIYFGPYAQSVDKVIGSYFKTFMTDGELIKTTQAFSQQNIAIREPYLDMNLIHFMAQVPGEIKIKGNIKKNLLKQISYDYIPRELLERPKKGFSVPFSAWMKNELKPLMMETLSPENLKKDGILNADYVTSIKNNFLNGKEEYKYKLWSILLYQLWYEKNMR